MSVHWLLNKPLLRCDGLGCGKMLRLKDAEQETIDKALDDNRWHAFETKAGRLIILCIQCILRHNKVTEEYAARLDERIDMERELKEMEGE